MQNGMYEYQLLYVKWKKPDSRLHTICFHLYDIWEKAKSYGFSSSHVGMWGLDHKGAECQRIDAFEL